jgi:aminoglycoside phosphotransferase
MNPSVVPSHLQASAGVRRLVGLSGANVQLLTRDDRYWFIRKSARDVAASVRLRGQAAKQLKFAEDVEGLIRTPKILDEGEIDGRYYFDMEFVRGMDGASYLRQASYGDVARLAGQLCDYLKHAATRPALSTSPSGSLFEALYSKICDVQQATGQIEPESLSCMFVGLNRLRNIASLSTTLCHGDLTLENIVIDADQNVWAVDLLDSPFEHYWQDVAKLHQDLSGGWYLANQPPIAKCVLDYLSRRLCQTAIELDPAYRQVHAILLACTFARILPYAATEEKRQLVLERINHFARLSVAAEHCPN